MTVGMTSTASETAQAATETTTFEGLARAGYVARGVIYVLIGILAVQLARGVGGENPDQEGAMRLIADQAFGRVLLVVVAIGLAGYSLWRGSMAFVGRTPEAGRHSALDRLGAAGSAIAYGTFCVLAIGILSGSSSGGKEPSSGTADVLGWPAGRLLVVVGGLVFLGIGLYQAYLGISKTFLKDSKTMYMSPRTLKGFTVLGMIGLLARGVTFSLIGIFFLKAAIEFDPKEAKGLDGALHSLTTQTYGTVALAVVAAGLIAFGIYSIVDARYRKI